MGKEPLDLLSEFHRDVVLAGLGYFAGDLAATWRASSCSSRVILRASAFGQPFIFDGQA